RPCPLANAALPPVRRGVFGPAYGQTVVRGKARFLASGERSGGAGFPLGRRAPRLSPQPAGGGAGLPAPQAFHQSLHLAVVTRRRSRAQEGIPTRFSYVSMDDVRVDVLGRLRPQRGRTARVRPPDSGLGSGGQDD